MSKNTEKKSTKSTKARRPLPQKVVKQMETAAEQIVLQAHPELPGAHAHVVIEPAAEVIVTPAVETPASEAPAEKVAASESLLLAAARIAVPNKSKPGRKPHLSSLTEVVKTLAENHHSFRTASEFLIQNGYTKASAQNIRNLAIKNGIRFDSMRGPNRRTKEKAAA